MNLYENFNDENSGMTVPLVNPWDETIEDSTFTMETANLNRPFDYTLELRCAIGMCSSARKSSPRRDRWRTPSSPGSTTRI